MHNKVTQQYPQKDLTNTCTFYKHTQLFGNNWCTSSASNYSTTNRDIACKANIYVCQGGTYFTCPILEGVIVRT